MDNSPFNPPILEPRQAPCTAYVVGGAFVHKAWHDYGPRVTRLRTETCEWLHECVPARAESKHRDPVLYSVPGAE
jgi:hypothetical protein